MEKETLISNLKTKVGDNDFGVLSERTIDNIVEQFMPMFADDEKITDETYNLPVTLLKSFAGQYRHDVKNGIGKGVAESKAAWETEQKAAQEAAIAQAIENAKKEWEKTNGGNGDAGGAGGNGGQEGSLDQKIADAITKAMGGLTGEEGALGKLTKQFGDYMKAQADKEKAATIARAKDELKSFLIELGADETKPKVIELALSEIEIGEVPVMSDLQKVAKSKYEALYKDLYGDGGKPFGGTSGGGGGSSSSSDELKAFLKMQEERDKAEAAHAEAMKEFLK